MWIFFFFFRKIMLQITISSKITAELFWQHEKEGEMVLNLIAYILIFFLFFFFYGMKDLLLVQRCQHFLSLESTAVSWHPAIRYLDLPLGNKTPFSNAHGNISFWAHFQLCNKSKNIFNYETSTNSEETKKLIGSGL